MALNRRSRWPPRNKPHIYKKKTDGKWTVRAYNPITKRAQATHNKSFEVICYWAKLWSTNP